MPDADPRLGPTLDMPRLDTGTTFRKEAYAALKRAITAMDIYDHAGEIRLDERRLSEGLGVSRTPIREAMTLLEQEGFVRTRPRRGIFVVRKTKREIVEMITVMAALESMAARLAAERATAADIGRLHGLMDEFQNGANGARLDEYSDANIAFHQALISLSESPVLIDMTNDILLHVRGYRQLTMDARIAPRHRCRNIWRSSRRLNRATPISKARMPALSRRPIWLPWSSGPTKC